MVFSCRDLACTLCSVYFICPLIFCRVITKPNGRIIAIQKTKLILNCITDRTGNSIYWLHLGVGEISPRVINEESRVYGQWVTENRNGGTWNLTTESVDFRHAGRYTCQDSESTSKVELVVVSDNSTCRPTPVAVANSVFVEGKANNESITLECRVRYSGNFGLTLYWIDAANNDSQYESRRQIWEKSVNSSIREIKSRFNFNANERTDTNHYYAAICPSEISSAKCLEYWRYPGILLPPQETPNPNESWNVTGSEKVEASSIFPAPDILTANSSTLFQLIAIPFSVLTLVAVSVCASAWGYTLLQRHRMRRASAHQHQQRSASRPEERSSVDGESPPIETNERNNGEEIPREDQTYEEISIGGQEEYERNLSKFRAVGSIEDNVNYCPLRLNFESLRKSEYAENTLMNSQCLHTSLTSAAGNWHNAKRNVQNSSNGDYIVVLP